MKKILSIITLLFIIYACDDDPGDEVIESVQADFQVRLINLAENYTYTDVTPYFITSLKISDPDQIENVWLRLINSSGSDVIKDKVVMIDDGNESSHGDEKAEDGIYSAKINMNQQTASGNYIIEFYVEFLIGKKLETRKVSLGSFNYNNSGINYAPELTYLNAPDTITVLGNRALAVIELTVTDQNGPGDIENVFFISTNPSGQSNNQKFFLLDDGNAFDSGDTLAGDNIYSIIIEANTSTTKGTYIFDFVSLDKGGAYSDTLSHNITIQ